MSKSFATFDGAFYGKSRFSTCTTNEAKGNAPQCVDGACLYHQYLTGSCPPRRSDARGFLDDLDPKDWEVVRYRSGMILPVGAIAVLDHKDYGHVMMGRRGSTRSIMVTLDQNWSIHGRFTHETHVYTECVGWGIWRHWNPTPVPPKPRKTSRLSLLASDGHHHGAWLNTPAGLARAHAAEDKLLLDPKITWVRLDRV